MKRFYLSKLIILMAIMLGYNLGANAQAPITFSTVGVTSYTVPLGVFSIAIDMKGAQGGLGNCSDRGGYGGRVQCTLATTPGQILNIYVGGVGTAYNLSNALGGYNGGATGYYYGGGGGGASDIRVAPYSLTDRLVVAGGGGGGSCNCGSQYGGEGGGLVGGMGGSCNGMFLGGGAGGSQSGGGAAGTYTTPAGSPGGFGVGGNGNLTQTTGGGGGGGGYYGGGGGSCYSSGGGGSSYTHPTLATAVTHTQGYTSANGNGAVVITPICIPPSLTTIITGQSLYCGVGVSAPLSNPGGSPGGTWSSSNPGVATVSNTGAVTSLGTGTANITYSVTYSCGPNGNPFMTVTVTPVPSPISGVAVVCGGSSTTLTDAGAGTWAGSNPFVISVNSTSGAVTGINGGTATVTYTLSSGCFTTITTTVNATPAPISGTPTVCTGSTTTFATTSTGGVWSSGGTGVATVGTGTGIVSGVALPGGSAPISYTYTSTGCAAVRNVTVNPLPAVESITGGGGYCSGGTGSPIGMNPSQAGVGYQLKNGGVNVGSPLTGTGGTLTYGSFTAPGTYTILGINATTGCSRTMSGTAGVSVNPLPIAFNLAFVGGSSYCEGTAGLDLTLSGSESGVLYQLYNGVTIGGPVLGSTAAIDYGYMTDEGTYSVLAFNTSTGCSNYMATNPTLSKNLLPAVYNVLDGGDYCAGGLGRHIRLDFSVPGIDYQLFNGSTPVVSFGGTSASLDFGLMTAVGTYTAVATNSITGCSSDMAGSADIIINPLPFSYPISGTGSYCAGTGGFDVSMSTSDFGISYQLYYAGSAIGMPVAGTGGIADFGMQTMAGTYSAMGVDDVTGCTSNMSGTAVVGINALPALHILSASDGGNYCAGGIGVHLLQGGSTVGVNYELFDRTGTVVGSLPGTGAPLDFGLKTDTGHYTVVATNAATCTNTMTGNPLVTINPLPALANVTGGGSFCASATGVHVGVDYTTLGTSYQLYLGSVPAGASVIGSGTDIDFGLKTIPGAYTVVAMNSLTGCTNPMTGTATVIVNPLPMQYGVTGSGSFCAGGAGLHAGIGGSAVGINYQLYMGSTAIGTALPGTGSPMDFGIQSDPGVYTVIATDGITACTNNMVGNATISVSPLPTAYNVTGGGEYCAGGTGLSIGLSSSNIGISYQLMNGSTMVGSPMLGTGAVLNFGIQTAGGNYTIGATNVTTTCTNTMAGSATITINALPVAWTVTGGGNYCTGGSGVHVGLANSATGINYQLYNGTTMVGSAVPGSTGSAVDFGLLTGPGTYTVSALNSITGCTNAMAGSRTIVTAALPTPYTVTGGGIVCEGTAGVHVGLTGSNSGISYQLMNGTSTSGVPVAGTGSAIDFGLVTTSGSYTIMATNTATTCASTMASAASVTVNPVPVAYATTGGGSLCAGGTGVSIGLVGSGWGNNYQLYNGSAAMGLPIGGTGAALDFGLQAAGGTYRIVGINTTTGCTNIMTGTPLVVVNPSVIPVVTITSSMGDNVCAGVVTMFGATAANGGSAPAYQWMVNGVNAGPGSSYSYVPMDGDVVTATLTSNADCASPVIVNRSMTMSVHPYVMPSATITSQPGTNVCPGTPVTYSVSTVNGGTAANYTWMKDNIPVASGSSYTYVPVNNDVINFRLMSSAMCRSADTIFSNDLVMKVAATQAPLFTITTHTANIINVGRVDTMWATVSNSGPAVSYQWYINGTAMVGATSTRFVANPVFDKDSFACVVTNLGPCGGASASKSIIVTLYDLAVKPVGTTSNIALVPNPNKGTFNLKGTFGTATDQDVTIEVTNVLGQVVYSNKVMTQNGAINERVQLNSGIANGMYILNMRSETEHATFHVVIEQ